jgi:hypothetical protein
LVDKVAKEAERTQRNQKRNKRQASQDKKRKVEVTHADWTDLAPRVEWKGLKFPWTVGAIDLPAFQSNIDKDFVEDQIEAVNTLKPYNSHEKQKDVLNPEFQRSHAPKRNHPLLGTVRCIHNAAMMPHLFTQIYKAVKESPDETVEIYLGLPSFNPRNFYYNLKRFVCAQKWKAFEHGHNIIVNIYHPCKPRFDKQSYMKDERIGWRMTEEPPKLTDIVWDFGLFLIRPHWNTGSFLATWVDIKESGGKIQLGNRKAEVNMSVSSERYCTFKYDDDSVIQRPDMTPWFTEGAKYQFLLSARVGKAWTMQSFLFIESPKNTYIGGTMRCEEGPTAYTITEHEIKTEEVRFMDIDYDARLKQMRKAEKLAIVPPTSEVDEVAEELIKLAVNLSASDVNDSPKTPQLKSKAQRKTKSNNTTIQFESGPLIEETPPKKTESFVKFETEKKAKQEAKSLNSQKLSEELNKNKGFSFWGLNFGAWTSTLARTQPPPQGSVSETVVNNFMTVASKVPEKPEVLRSYAGGIANRNQVTYDQALQVIENYSPYIAGRTADSESLTGRILQQTKVYKFMDSIVPYALTGLCLFGIACWKYPMQSARIIGIFRPSKAEFTEPFLESIGKTIRTTVYTPLIEETIRGGLYNLGIPRLPAAALMAAADVLVTPTASFPAQLAVHYALGGGSFAVRTLKHMSWNASILVATEQIVDVDRITFGDFTPNVALPVLDNILMGIGNSFATITEYDPIARAIAAVRGAAPTTASFFTPILNWLVPEEPEPVRQEIITNNGAKQTSLDGQGWYYLTDKHKVITPSVDQIEPAHDPAVSISPICPRLHIEQTLMPGNFEVTNWTAEDCNAMTTQGYAPLFRIKSEYSVFTFASCPCAMQQAIHNRMAGIPPLYANSLNPTADRAVCELNWINNMRIWENIYDESDDGPLLPNLPLPLTHEEWKMRYTLAERENITRAETLAPFKEHYDCMPKLEKNSLTYDYFESNRLIKKKDARGISIPAFAKRSKMGPECVYASEILKSYRRARFFFTSGTTEVERARWYQWASAQPVVSVAYAGDNMLFICDQFAICADMKRMDMHVHRESQLSVSRILNNLNCDTSATVVRRDIWKRYVYDKVLPKDLGNKKVSIRVRIRGTQPSGRGDTTFGNSVTVDMLCHEVIYSYQGLLTSQTFCTHLEQTCARYGFLVETAQVNTRERPLDVEFLQQRFWRVIGKQYERAPGNRIGRILIRTFWTKDRLKTAKNIGLMRGIALSLHKQNTHVPLVNTLLQRILEITSKTIVYYDREWSKKIKYMVPAECEHEEHPLSKAELAMTLGVTLQQVLDLDNELSTLTFGSLLADDPKFADIIRQLALWDL